MTDPETRFWAKVDKHGPMRSPYLGPCWVWTAYITEHGYPIFDKARAHTAGPMSTSWQRYPRAFRWIDHLCRVRHCVNPAHLEAVTQTENVLRGNSPQAKNKRKTHCKNGHPFDASNTRRRRNTRECRACIREFMRQLRAEGKA